MVYFWGVASCTGFMLDQVYEIVSSEGAESVGHLLGCTVISAGSCESATGSSKATPPTEEQLPKSTSSTLTPVAALYHREANITTMPTTPQAPTHWPADSYQPMITTAGLSTSGKPASSKTE